MRGWHEEKPWDLKKYQNNFVILLSNKSPHHLKAYNFYSFSPVLWNWRNSTTFVQQLISHQNKIQKIREMREKFKVVKMREDKWQHVLMKYFLLDYLSD